LVEREAEQEASAWSELDPVLTAPKRLAAMALLRRAGATDFGFLREHLRVSDSDLSKQMAALQAADYVKVAKTGRGRGATTSFAITRAGRAAYDAHRATLQSMLGD
jgi:DNA-binding transcriptional ArsR family regulator